MVPADERRVHAHEIDVCNVVHKEEELCLSTRRLCNELMHLLKRWHVWGIVSETAYDVLADMLN